MKRKRNYRNLTWRVKTNEKKEKIVWDILLIIVILVGMTVVVFNAVNGDRYRYLYLREFHMTKALTCLCMVFECARIMYRLVGTKKNTAKYSVVVILCVLIAVMMYVVNNLFHYLGYVSAFGIDGVKLSDFMMSDLTYLNGIGMLRYAFVFFACLGTFFIIDKRVLGKIADVILSCFDGKFNLLKLFGMEDYEDNDKMESGK